MGTLPWIIQMGPKFNQIQSEVERDLTHIEKRSSEDKAETFEDASLED